MNDLLDHGYDLIGSVDPASRPPLDPDPLNPEACAGCAYEDGYGAGVAAERARLRRVDHFAAVMLAAAIVALLIVAYVAGQASAASRGDPVIPAATPSTGAVGEPDQELPGAPRSGMAVKVLEAEATRAEPALAGWVGAPKATPATVRCG